MTDTTTQTVRFDGIRVAEVSIQDDGSLFLAPTTAGQREGLFPAAGSGSEIVDALMASGFLFEELSPVTDAIDAAQEARIAELKAELARLRG